MPKESVVWLYFTRGEKIPLDSTIEPEYNHKRGGTDKKVYCRVPECQYIHILNSQGTTTELIRHLEIAHRYNRDTGQLKLREKQDVVAPIQKIKTQEAIVNFVVDSFSPFSIVENVQFRNLFHMFNPFFAIPTRVTVKNWAQLEYKKKKEIIKEIFSSVKSNIHICLDGWSSPGCMYSMVGITAHFYYNQKILSINLGMKESLQSHTAENLSNILCEVLDDYSIGHKVATITGDNASNIQAIGKPFFNYVKERHPTSPFKQNNVLGCAAHSFNLAVKDFCSHPLISDVISKFKMITKLIRKSEPNRRLFREICQQHEKSNQVTKIDVETRFSSKYIMIKNILELKAVLIDFFKKKEEYSYSKSNSRVIQVNIPIEADWNKLEKVQEVLVIFNSTINFVCDEDWNLSSTLPLFNFLQSNLKAIMNLAEDPTIQETVIQDTNKAKLYKSKFKSKSPETLKIS